MTDTDKPRAGLCGDAFVVDFRRIDLDGAQYFLPAYAEQRPACRAIAGGKFHEPRTHRLVRRLLKRFPGSMVHAGTFFGDMLPSFSKSCPGRVYAFEPVLENYVLAKTCVQENGLDNVVLLNAALGERVEVGRIQTHAEDGSHFGGASRLRDEGQIVSVLAIDALRIAELSVLQLDVEGFELQALKGAVATIRDHRPVILVEDNAGTCPPFLRAMGYKLLGKLPGISAWAHAERMEEVSEVWEPRRKAAAT